jgi:hypothetical protein
VTVVVLRWTSIPTVLEARPKTGRPGIREDQVSEICMSGEKPGQAVEVRVILAVEAEVLQTASSKVRPEEEDEVDDGTSAGA